MVRDISNAYNSIKTGFIEKHTRRYWLRFSKEEDWRVFEARCLMLGETPAVGVITCTIEWAKDT